MPIAAATVLPSYPRHSSAREAKEHGSVTCSLPVTAGQSKSGTGADFRPLEVIPLALEKSRHVAHAAGRRDVWASGRSTAPAQAAFAAPHAAAEELYDLETDPHEIHDLAATPDHRATLEKPRAVLDRWMEEACPATDKSSQAESEKKRESSSHERAPGSGYSDQRSRTTKTSSTRSGSQSVNVAHTTS
jgi:hypothetical protein